MPCAWKGTVGVLKRKWEQNTFLSELREGYERIYGTANQTETAAWEGSIGSLVSDVLGDSQLDSAYALFEFRMPIGSERADVVLVGGSDDNPRLYVLELKQWSRASYDTETRLVSVPGLGVHQHPVDQALNYKGKLRLFLQEAAHGTVAAGAWLHNMTDCTLITSGLGRTDLAGASLIFAREGAHSLRRDLETFLLPCYIDGAIVERLDRAEYSQTIHLTDIIRRYGNDIATRAEVALAEHGIGLTVHQQTLVGEVLASATARDERVYVVRGGPGSGKTLVAVTLLLRSLERGLRCILALRNNRLRAILEACFNESYRGASGTLIYFEDPMRHRAIGDPDFLATFDLLICDEAQRIKAASIPTALKRAPTSVVFLDEGQRLNPPEAGTSAHFAESAIRIGKDVAPRSLPMSMRCRGGSHYHEWVEALLGDFPSAEDLKVNRQLWKQNYVTQCFSTISDLIGALKAQGKYSRVALVAGFTESPGVMGNPSHPDNLRVGYPLTSGFDRYIGSEVRIAWLMDPREYVKFWMGGGSAKLDRVASIYGAQGFESDYVGLIWGRDLVVRNGCWTLGAPAYCYDRVEGLINKARTAWTPGALELLRNRYRIFLTRGIRGTFIYCEDAETQEFLQTLVAG